jgi:3-phenylpropionate/trans-cinnamate dioxygenase ferredoxin reductase component
MIDMRHREDTPSRIVIVGGGEAAVEAIDTLRRNAYEGAITLISAEPTLPYERPPLSKAFLLDDPPVERLLRPAAHYDVQGVEVRLSCRVTLLKPECRRVVLEDGSSVLYSHLLLATGGRPRQLGAARPRMEGVHVLRTLADAQVLRARLRRAARVVIVGGGYIGLEVAAVCRQLGIEVVVLQGADRVLRRVTSPIVSSFYHAEHERKGARIRCNTTIDEIIDDGAGRVCAVRCSDGARLDVDLVLIAIGLEPADELARQAGLACLGGILVDEQGRTRDPVVFAAGDCANQFRARYGCSLRLESVDNARSQARSAALSMVGSQKQEDCVPSFWSDQYDLNLVSVGLCHSYDRYLIRGSLDARRFSICYLSRGEFVGIDSVNAPRDQLAARKLIASRARPDPGKLQDASIPLKDCV